MSDDPTVVIRQAFPNYVFKTGDIMAIEQQNYQYNSNGVFTITDSDAQPIDDMISPSSLEEFFPGRKFYKDDTITLEGIAYSKSSDDSAFLKSTANAFGGIGGTI